MSGIDSYTKLMLHADGSGNDFTDSSFAGHSLTAVGDATQTSDQSKFGGKSAYFDGAGDYLTSPDSEDWDFGSGDFTIDWWEYRTASGDNKAAISRSLDAFSPFLAGYANGGHLTFFATSNGTTWDIANNKSMGAITLNEWVHLAVVRHGNTWYLFKNGDITTTWESSAAILASSSSLIIGNYYANAYYQGYIDELRLSKGIARWTANFTPPTEAYSSDLAILPAGIPTLEQFGTPAVFPTIIPAGIISAEIFGTATIILTLQPAGITSQEDFGSPEAQPDAVVLQPEGIGSGEVCGTPTLVQIAQIIKPEGLVSQEALGYALILPGLVSIQPAALTSQEAFGSPEVQPGAGGSPVVIRRFFPQGVWQPYHLQYYGLLEIWDSDTDGTGVFAYNTFEGAALYLINSTMAGYEIEWEGAQKNLRLYRQHTLDLKVSDKSDSPLSGANVKIYDKDANLAADLTTGADGKIPPQRLTYKRYFYDGGTQTQDYYPYRLVISKAGYEAYEDRFNPDRKLDLEVALAPYQPRHPLEVELPGLAPLEAALRAARLEVELHG
ncbi:MAG: LamG-like jellyroll fold domain-containing protein [Thermodesulfobacteriota bacterium]